MALSVVPASWRVCVALSVVLGEMARALKGTAGRSTEHMPRSRGSTRLNNGRPHRLLLSAVQLSVCRSAGGAATTGNPLPPSSP